MTFSHLNVSSCYILNYWQPCSQSVASLITSFIATCCYIAEHVAVMLRAWRPSVCVSVYRVSGLWSQCNKKLKLAQDRIGQCLGYLPAETKVDQDRSILRSRILVRNTSEVQEMWVSKFCLNEWQEIWDCCEGNKLHSIYPTVGSVAHSKNMSRYDSVLINRLHIGHSRLTHSHILCGDDLPTCQLCGLPVSVRHILVECVGLRDIR